MKYVAGFLILFFLAGFFTGCTADIDEKSTLILKNLALEEPTSPRVKITYRCDDADKYVYDVDRNSANEVDAFGSRANNEVLTLDEVSDVVLIFLGGSSAGVRYTDLRKTSGLKHATRYAVFVLLGFSGYPFGKYLASKLRSCNSKEVWVPKTDTH